jgi:hypothetical protein
MDTMMHSENIKKRPIDLYELDEEYFIASEELNEAEKTLNEELD